MPDGVKPTYDEGQWPALVVTLPAKPLDSAAFEKYVTDVSAYYVRGQAFGYVFDIRRAPPFSANQRRRIADEIERSAARHPNVRVFVAVVIDSAIQRGIVKAITWLTPQPLP